MNADKTLKITQHATKLIDPSPYQTRKHFDEQALQGLAASLKDEGFIQPLVARESSVDPARLELIAGERRLRAARIAGLETVPVIVRDITDLAAREIVIIENLQREDLTITEEANGYRMALDLRDEGGRPVYTQASLGAKIKKNESYIADRLKLLACPAELIQAVEEKMVALSTAMLVGRIPDVKERGKCAKEVLNPSTQEVPLNFEQTRELIREKYMVSLQTPGFALTEEGLVKIVLEGGVRVMGGACTDCPFCLESGTDGNRSRNSEATERGGELLRKSGVKLCTLPPCYKKKQEASWVIVRRLSEEQGLKVIEGDAARRMFNSWNGELSDSCGYVQLSKKPESNHVGWQLAQQNTKTWGGLVKGTDIATVIVRHPTNGQRIEVVDAKEATVIAKAKIIGKVKEREVKAAALDAAADLGLNVEPGAGGKLDPAVLAVGIKSVEDAEAARKAQRKEELRKQKIEKITLNEGLSDLAEAIGRKGMDAENLEYLFQVTLENSGADGFGIMKDWLGLKMPPGAASSARSYEEAILKTMRVKATTPFQWLGYIVVATLAKTLRWNGLSNKDMQELWKRYGIKQPELARRATAILDAGKKGTKVTLDEGDDGDELELGLGSGPSPTELLTGVQDTKLVTAIIESGIDEADAGPSFSYSLENRRGWLEGMMGMPIEPSWPNRDQVFAKATSFSIPMPHAQSPDGHAIIIRLARDVNGGWYNGYQWDRPVHTPSARGGELVDVSEGRKHGSRTEALADVLQTLCEEFCYLGEEAAETLMDNCLDGMDLPGLLPSDDELPLDGGSFYHCDGCGKVCDGTGYERSIEALAEFRCVPCGDFTQLGAKRFLPLPVKEQEEFETWVPERSAKDDGAFDVTAAAELVMQGKSYPEVIGEERPAEGSLERKAWEAKKVKIWKVVQKLKKAA